MKWVVLKYNPAKENQMTPKAFKKSNKEKEIRACKRGTAAQAIGKIEKNTDTFILTFGQFSKIDTLMAILDQTGPAHVVISTWTAAHAHLDVAAGLIESSDILSFRMIIDRSFKTRKPKFFNQMRRLFGDDSIREINAHSKFMIIKNSRWNIVVRTSMNLTGNRRLENLEISESRDFVNFFIDVVDDIFSEVKINENRWEDLDLSNIKEKSLFNEVSANYIKRKNLKEPRCSHELKKY